MIFGYKQKGKHAKSAFNLFFPLSYEEHFKKIFENNETDDCYLQGMIDQVVHFGQTPSRVFHSAHVTRDLKTTESNIFDKYRKFNENNINGCKIKGEICAILLTSKYLILVKHYQYKVSILRIDLSGIDDNHVIFDQKKERILVNSKPSFSHSPYHYCMFGENKIASGNHLDNSIKIHSISGKIIYSLHAHTSLVSTISSLNNLLISGSLDSSIFSWELSNNKITMKNKYLGHMSSIIQVCTLNSFQLLISLGKNGDILIHDIRTGECIHGIETEFTGICVSCLKFIAGYNHDMVQILDLQGICLWKRKIKANFAKFDNSGMNFYYCSSMNWGFFNVFDDHKRYEKTELNPVNIIMLSSDQSYFLHSEIEGNYSLVYTFEILNKELMLANQGSNFKLKL